MNESLNFPDPGLAGRNALVTGGSRGIGRAIVERLAGAGMDVTFTYLGNEAAAQEVVSANPGLKITAVRVDARESEAARLCVELLIDRVGTLDVLVNNAGVIRDNLLPMLEDEDLREVFSTTKALAVEVGRRGIRVNAVAPGVIETEMSKQVRDLAGDEIISNIVLKRYGLPSEIANAVWFLSSDLASYITGQVLSVDGGFKM